MTFNILITDDLSSQGLAHLEEAADVTYDIVKGLSPAALAERIASRLRRTPLHIAGKAGVITKIGWCTGSAQNYIELAHAAGVDAYLTGEVSEQTVHFARETGLHFFAAGHHATERYGVQAVGEYLAETCGLKHVFVDIDNPV